MVSNQKELILSHTRMHEEPSTVVGKHRSPQPVDELSNGPKTDDHQWLHDDTPASQDDDFEALEKTLKRDDLNYGNSRPILKSNGPIADFKVTNNQYTHQDQKTIEDERVITMKNESTGKEETSVMRRVAVSVKDAVGEQSTRNLGFQGSGHTLACAHRFGVMDSGRACAYSDSYGNSGHTFARALPLWP